MPPQAYLSTDPNEGTPATSDYLSTDPMAGTTPASHAPAAGDALARYGAGLWKNVNPVAIATGLYHAVESPEAVTRTLESLATAHGAQFEKAREFYRQGDYEKAAAYTVAGLLPALGPATTALGERIREGDDVAGALGEATGLVGQLAVPGAVAKTVKSIPVVPRIGTKVPAPVAEAVQFGLREGIPVDVATATANPFLRGAQRLSEESLLGSQLVSPSARGAQAEALTATGGRLAGRTSPAPVTAEQAGQAVRTRVTGTAAGYDAAADAAYAKLRALEARQAAVIQHHGGVQAPATQARPFTNVPLAVDIVPTKAAMRPIYDALTREAELVPLMGDKARALTSLDRLMRAPDLAPLSIADGALGELKSLARVDQTFRRTAGQGVAAEAVTNLDKAVRAAAQQAGPDAMQALMSGRAATVNKFKTIELLDTLHAEPVKVFNQATWAKDAGIAQLRALARVAPTELRQVGRAWLENALTKATAEGGFSRAPGLLAEWQNLGSQTKQLLFGTPAHVKDLDDFFLLAKRMTENPNPSGSALTAFKGGELTALGSGAMLGAPGVGVGYTLAAPVVAKLLLSPTTTRLLLQGLRLPVSAKAARTTWAASLERAINQAAPTLIPAATEEAPAP